MFTQLHARALKAVSNLEDAERRIIPIVQEIDAGKGFRELGYPSLFSYLVAGLGLTEASTYHFIRVSRRAAKVASFQAAILKGEIPISKAKIIAAAITNENAEKWIGLAKTKTARELEKDVAEANPDISQLERVRHKAKNLVELTITLDTETLALLNRTKEVLAQKRKTPITLARALNEIGQYYLTKEDPLRKAERAVAKNSGGKDPLVRARQKALVRDQAKCQFKMPDGKICASRQWIDLHHIHPQAEGGEDNLENLITLCSAHHRMAHH